MGSLYTAGYSGFSGATGPTGFSGLSGFVFRRVCDHRLTLTSGYPVYPSNQEAKTTLYFTPYIGRQISLYYNSVWTTYQTDEISASLSGKTANKNYDVFAYYTGSAVALELIEWASDNARDISIGTQDDIYVKSTDPTRRLVGTIRTTGTTGQCEDSYSSRFVWNMQNKIKRWGFTYNSTVSWTYTTAAWREYNGGTNHVRLKFVLGTQEEIFIENYSDTAGTCQVGAAIDTTTSYTTLSYLSAGRVIQGPDLYGTSIMRLGVGYHYMTAVEYNISGTMTNYGYGAPTSPGYCHVAYFDN